MVADLMLLKGISFFVENSETGEPIAPETTLPELLAIQERAEAAREAAREDGANRPPELPKHPVLFLRRLCWG